MSRITALALAAFLASGAALAQEQPKPSPRIVSLTGEGEVAAQPDIALLSVSVVTEARGASEAFTRQRERAAAVVAAIKEAGIEDRDIQTSNVSITPRVAHSSGRAPRTEGYTAQNDIEIRVRQLDKAGAVLDSLVKAGVNEIGGISFDFSDRVALLDRARQAAAADVRRKADLYAEAFGVKVARLSSLSENDAPPARPQPMRRYSAESMAAASPTPIVAGEQTLRVTINAVFEIE